MYSDRFISSEIDSFKSNNHHLRIISVVARHFQAFLKIKEFPDKSFTAMQHPWTKVSNYQKSQAIKNPELMGFQAWNFSFFRSDLLTRIRIQKR